MTARRIATATISFGLVSIPVGLYTTSESSNDISFNMLHDADGARLKQQYVCTACNEVVDKEHTLKGYEHAAGQYVTFTPEELEQLATAVDHQTIAIAEFIGVDELPLINIEKAYYLAPDKGSDEAFALLGDVLATVGGFRGRAAIARYAARGHEHVVAIVSHGTYLALLQLRFAHEVRTVADLPELAARRPNVDHYTLALAIADQMTSPALDLTAYRDGWNERARRAIDAKVAGGEVVVEPTAAPPSIAGLEAALRASIDQSRPVAPRAEPAEPAVERIVHRDDKPDNVSPDLIGPELVKRLTAAGWTPPAALAPALAPKRTRAARARKASSRSASTARKSKPTRAAKRARRG